MHGDSANGTILIGVFTSVCQWGATCYRLYFPILRMWKVSDVFIPLRTEILTGDRHLDDLPNGQLQKVTKVKKPNSVNLEYRPNSELQWLFIEEVYYMLLHWTIKQAFLLFYLRLSPQKGFQIAVYTTMGINTSFTIINWMLAFFQCRPLDALIHPEAHPNAQCLSQYAVMMVPTALVRCLLNTTRSLQCQVLTKTAILECRFRRYHSRSANPDCTEASYESQTKGCCSRSNWFRFPVRCHGNVPLHPSGPDG